MPYRVADTGDHHTGIVFHCSASAFLIAKIKASQSFGSIVGPIITLGLYSSMEITVTCAADDMSSEGVDSESVVTVPPGSDEQEVMDAFGRAVDMAVANEQPAYVQFEGDPL